MANIQFQTDRKGVVIAATLDGVLIDGISFRGHLTLGGSARTYATLQSVEIPLGELSFRDLAPHFSLLEIETELGWNDMRTNVRTTFSKDINSLVFSVRPDVARWAGPFSMTQFFDALHEELRGPNFTGVNVEDQVFASNDRIDLCCTIRDPDSSLRSEINYYWTEVIKPLLSKIRIVLSEEIQRDTLVTLFRFPPAIRTSCEQYLVYFGQFLEDLGIRAATDLRHREAGELLFSVRPEGAAPTDLAAALTNIHMALSAYLELPGAPEFGSPATQYSDIAVLQLQSNIQHLQSQLSLATAVMRAQQAEIGARTSEVEYLRLSNAQLHQLVAAAPELNQLSRAGWEYGEADPARPESLLGGLVTAIPYEGPGVSVNVPEIVRKLKRRLGRE